MKKAAFLLFLYMALFAGCKKDETENTGTLKMTFTLSAYDYSNISIYIYSLENLDYALITGHPVNKGVFVQELLPGNYHVDVWYTSLHVGPTFQIVNGEVSSITMSLNQNE